MKIPEFLQKIGILCIGETAGTYTGAKDAPDGLMTNVYKPKKKPSRIQTSKANQPERSIDILRKQVDGHNFMQTLRENEKGHIIMAVS